MRNALFVLTVVSFCSVSLWGQYPVVPKTGEGRYDRSSETVFLPNRIFTHPSIFFRDGQTDIRPARKWWRTPMQTVSPLPVSRLEKQPVNPKIPATEAMMSPPLVLNQALTPEREISKAGSSTDQPTGIDFRWEPVAPTNTCRLTRQILNHLRSSDEMDFLIPVNTGKDLSFP